MSAWRAEVLERAQALANAVKTTGPPLVLELIRALRAAEEELNAREADVRVLAVALDEATDLATAGMPYEAHDWIGVYEVLERFKEWIPQPEPWTPEQIDAWIAERVAAQRASAEADKETG